MSEMIRELISEEEVDKRIRELGEEISRDYAGKQIHLICVLKGGVHRTGFHGFYVRGKLRGRDKVKRSRPHCQGS